jgi:ABC-type multidrug transport system fused ATPase/permease subunit
LFFGEDGKARLTCSNCEKQIETMMQSNNSVEIKAALNYIHTCRTQATDSEVASYLGEIVDNNSLDILELESKNKKPVNFKHSKDYFQDRSLETSENTSIWISGLRTAAWIYFFTVIAIGLSISLVFNDNVGIAFLVMVFSFLLAFMSVAGVMIFLNIAQHIAEIRNELTSKNRFSKKNKTGA